MAERRTPPASVILNQAVPALRRTDGPVSDYSEWADAVSQTGWNRERKTPAPDRGGFLLKKAEEQWLKK